MEIALLLAFVVFVCGGIWAVYKFVQGLTKFLLYACVLLASVLFFSTAGRSAIEELLRELGVLSPTVDSVASVASVDSGDRAGLPAEVQAPIPSPRPTPSQTNRSGLK